MNIMMFEHSIPYSMLLKDRVSVHDNAEMLEGFSEGIVQTRMVERSWIVEWEMMCS